MAPSNMFSYLRPHNRRNASNPASPDPHNASAQSIPSPSQQSDILSSPRPGDNASFTSASPVSPYPPQLPPIPRVASRIDRLGSSSAITSPQPPTSQQSSNTGVGSQVAEERGLRPASQSPQDQLSPSYENRRPSSRSTTASLSPPIGFRTKGQSLAEVVEQAAQESTPLLPPSNVSTNYSQISRSQTSLVSGLSDRLLSNAKTTSSAAPPQKSGKSRLNLRNPMSLLMRRRSAQTLEHLSDESLVSHRSPSIVPPMPDNYDPSIRGRIVHDFSAPRPSRNFSYNNAYGSNQGKSGSGNNAVDGATGRVSPQKVEREHTPVFREHFDDDTSYKASQAAIRAEQLMNRDFVARNSMLPPAPERSPTPPPPVPKDSPPGPPPQPSLPSAQAQEKPPEYFASSVLSPVQETSSPTDAPTEETPRKRKSTKTPPASRSRATSVTDPSFTPAGLPAHLTSRSSRFSFQIAGNDSAQEKILEERHKQKAAEKASKQVRNSTNTLDDEYGEYGMDMEDFDMDDGLEEEIPMLGDDGFGDDGMCPGMAAFDFSSFALPVNNPMSPVSMNGDTLQTPRDANGNAIGFALSDNDMQKVRLPAPGRHLTRPEAPLTELHGLGLMDLQQGTVDQSQITPADNPEDVGTAKTDQPTIETVDLGDDLYFDDGMIEEQGELDAVEFDENVFDDPSHLLYERKIKNAPVEDLRTGLSSHPLDIQSSETGYEADDDIPRHLTKNEPSLAHKPSMAHQKPVPDFTNLNTYYSALADAANRAEAEGRFARKESIDTGVPSSDIDDSSSLSNSRPSLIPDDGRFSQETTGFPPDDDGFGMSSSFVDDYDCSDYDSALEDDPMIAAANAEALANDYEGFYGQEFGFYASAQGEAVNAYGGFFGQSGLGRSVSGRNAVREPNLTPITERSEYSTRNSFISVSHFRDGQQPIQSPGLAQLARISPYGWPEEDPDMSLNSLMKLRKGAFGGSSVSLGSSTGNSPRNSSPMGMQYVPRNASPMANYKVPNEETGDSDGSAPVDHTGYEEDDEALDAINAIPEEYSDSDGEGEEEGKESPTLTASDYNSLSSPAPPLPALNTKDIPAPLRLSQTFPTSQTKTVPPPLSLSTTFSPPLPPQDTNLSSPVPMSAGGSNAPRRQSLGLISPVSMNSPLTPGGGWKAGHSRKGSAADSVAYVREHDEQGGDRWVLERRRTAESGELELVGREIVEGGRI
ncbi:hypothetical protein K469DRAFT_716484 [Zopfia rhizophila CBS 207.26]|uniref:AGC-kinase C-terminal domain-containing protein n=1 Tax=Zopfia rhizophila CBS 207.26 TaxID=1314779 RepID=A0A6A6DLG6_9PEZI|nr:hypothetical protein K469DRAFT_716484 [Zopfia rhizophila CBS 207.26]